MVRQRRRVDWQHIDAKFRSTEDEVQQMPASMCRCLDMLLKTKRLDHAQKFHSVAIGHDVQVNIEVAQDYCG